MTDFPIDWRKVPIRVYKGSAPIATLDPISRKVTVEPGHSPEDVIWALVEQLWETADREYARSLRLQQYFEAGHKRDEEWDKQQKERDVRDTT